MLFNAFQLRSAFHMKTNHLICTANQMTSFHMKYTNELKWAKLQLILSINRIFIQQTLTCSKSTIGTLEKSVKYVQS